MTMTDTRPRFIAPRSMLERKPKYGQPCNNCGLCCVSSLCDLGQYVFKRAKFPGPCPALIKDGEHKYVCGVVRDPLHYAHLLAANVQTLEERRLRAAALLIIGANTACDARFNGEPRDPVFGAKMDRYDAQERVVRARKLWGLT